MREVTVNGSPTSDGISEPCSITRAVQLANLGVSDVFTVRPGYYCQPRLTLRGANTTWMFDKGAELTGVGPLAHEADWLEGPADHVWSREWFSGSIGTVVQSGRWLPITVDDRDKDGKSFGRSFALTHPVQLKWMNTPAEVGTQAGTWSFAAGRFYVHLYHGGRPVLEDLLTTSIANNGSLVVEGRNVDINGLTIRHTSGTGLHITSVARDAVLTDITAINAQVWLEGVGTVADGLDISHVIKQGPPNSQGASSSHGMTGECWNAHGQGHGLLIGRQRSNRSANQIVRNSLVHRCWNGASLAGRQTLETTFIYGCPNHALDVEGVGATVRHCTMHLTQDSLFARGDFDGWTIENNVFHGGVYVVTDDGAQAGLGQAGPWSFLRNICNTLTVDWPSHRAMSSSENRRIDRTGEGYRVIDTYNGERGFVSVEIPDKL